MSGKRNSFQLKMKARMKAASRPGRARGRITLATITGSEAPSKAALSTRSRGTSASAVRMTQIANGIWNAAKSRISPVRVSISPRVFIARWIGISVVTGGNMRGSRIVRNSAAFPRKSRKVNVTAAKFAIAIERRPEDHRRADCNEAFGLDGEHDQVEKRRERPPQDQHRPDDLAPGEAPAPSDRGRGSVPRMVLS